MWNQYMKTTSLYSLSLFVVLFDLTESWIRYGYKKIDCLTTTNLN